MSIFAEKKEGVLTGNLIVEVRVDGKLVRRRVKSKRAATKLEAELKSGIIPNAPTRNKAMTVGDLRDAVKVLWHGDKDEANSLARLQRACEHLGTSKLVSGLSVSDIDHMHAQLRSLGLKDATLNRYNAVVSRMFDWAVERPGLTGMTKAPTIQWFSEPPQKFSWLEAEDEARVIAWLTEGNVRGVTGQKVALVVQVLTLTGVRVGELLDLKPSAIDPERETVTLWDTKNEDNRTQYLPRDLCERLKALKRHGTFPSYRTIQKVFYRARKALGLDPKLTIHGLRHSTATRLAMHGVNQRVIMEYMGHRSMATTNRYTHVNAATKRDAARVLMEMTRGDQA